MLEYGMRFAELLFSLARARILAVLVNAPESGLHLQEIAKQSGMDAGKAGGELRKLQELGAISSCIAGGQRLFKISKDVPVYKEVASFIRKTECVAEELRAALEPFAPRIKLAYIYGSYARRTMGGKSGIELMVVGKVKLNEVEEAVEGLSERFGRKIIPAVCPYSRYRRELAANGIHMHDAVFGVKIALIGETNGFLGT